VKERPSSKLKRFREELQKKFEQFAELFERETEHAGISVEGPLPESVVPFYLEILILEYLRWKTILVKEILKCKDFSEHLELDPQKCAVGKFLSSFCPTTEVGRYLVEEIRGVHEKLHEEARRLAEEIRTRNPDCEDIRKILQERLFPLFNELLELLIDLSNHLEKGEPES